MYVHKLKLRPPQLYNAWIDRPHLRARFPDESGLVAVVAGPGYGKTVLAAQRFAQWHGPKLWYSLDTADGDLAVFVAHMDVGLRSLGAQAPLLDASNATALGAPAEIASRLAEALAEINQRVLFTFDDVHQLEKSRSLPALASFIERALHLGAQVVVSGRSMPLSLHGVAATGVLIALSSEDLVFSENEASRFIGAAGPKGAQLSGLVARAEGWPAGLALMAAGTRDLTGFSERNLAPLASHDDEARRFLFDYLASEVLKTLNSEERSFLLETAILEQLETSLCDALHGEGSAKVLSSFAQRGLFVTRSSDEGYKAHQLFREFLQHQLRDERSAADIAALHRRAAVFLESRGDVPGAMRHHLEAGEESAAANLLEDHAFQLLRAGLVNAVAGTLKRLAPERIQSSAVLLVALGRVQRERGQWDAALPSLEKAQQLALNSRQFAAFTEAVRTAAPILASRGEFVRLREMLDQALSPALGLPAENLTALRMTLAAVLLEMNQLDESLAIYRELTPAVVGRGDQAAHGLILHNTAVAHIRRGDIFNGLTLYERALRLKTAAGQRMSALTTMGDLIYVKTLLGHTEEAAQLVETLLADALDLGVNGVLARGYEQQGALNLLRGDIAAAKAAYQRALEACDPGDTLLLPEIDHGLSRCALVEREAELADELCARAAAVFRKTERWQQLSPVLVTRAEIALQKRDLPAAVRFAGEALVEAKKGNNALLQAMTELDAALVLVSCAAHLPAVESTSLDDRAAAAAGDAVALIHQRDYRFLLRTKAREFGSLQTHLRRWNIGAALLPEVTGEPSVGALRIELLGPLRIYANGRQVGADAWKRKRAIDIFAYLVSQRGHAVPRGRLIDLYWPDSDADAAHDNLRVTITAIRKALGDVIRYESNAYRFAPPSDTVVDIDLFNAHLEAARQADAAGERELAHQRYRAAVDLYRGEFLDGMQDAGWQWRERERVHAAALEALRWIADHCLAKGDIGGVRQAVERLLEVAPFDLEAVRMRLNALVDEHRLAEAQRDYQAWRARYKAAIGVDAPAVWQAPESSLGEVRVPTLAT